ncbi:MAG TPA: hypothetical protein VFO38_02525 [Candidatus Saccharimonadales bacterium]|nr:hypothetical protein [Candidatus Saccharimonadales bacterium]
MSKKKKITPISRSVGYGIPYSALSQENALLAKKVSFLEQLFTQPEWRGSFFVICITCEEILVLLERQQQLDPSLLNSAHNALATAHKILADNTRSTFLSQNPHHVSKQFEIAVAPEPFHKLNWGLVGETGYVTINYQQ